MDVLGVFSDVLIFVARGLQTEVCLSSLDGMAWIYFRPPSLSSDGYIGVRYRLRETIRQSTLEDVFGRYGRVSRCVMRNNGNNSCTVFALYVVRVYLAHFGAVARVQMRS